MSNNTQETPDPLKPSKPLLMSLGSVLIHALEYMSPDGRELDLLAMQNSWSPEVEQWIAQMEAKALIPMMRKKRKQNP